MSEPSTDSKQCKLMLDPEFFAAVEERRGTKTRPAYIIEMAVKGMGLTDYTPRGRGKPKKSGATVTRTKKSKKRDK